MSTAGKVFFLHSLSQYNFSTVVMCDFYTAAVIFVLNHGCLRNDIKKSIHPQFNQPINLLLSLNQFDGEKDQIKEYMILNKSDGHSKKSEIQQF